MSDEVEIEAEIDKYLAFFKTGFEQVMETRGGNHKWDEVNVNRDQLRQATLHVHNRRKFKIFHYGNSLGKIEEVSLLCSKVHELKPFRLDSYVGNRDINACLNSMFLFQAVKEVRYYKFKKYLTEQGRLERGMEVMVWHSSPDILDGLYQNFLFDKLSERDLMKLADVIGQGLHASIYQPDKPE